MAVVAEVLGSSLLIAGGLFPIILAMRHIKSKPMGKSEHKIIKNKRPEVHEDPVQDKFVSKGPAKSPVVVTETTEQAIKVLKDEV